MTFSMPRSFARSHRSLRVLARMVMVVMSLWIAVAPAFADPSGFNEGPDLAITLQFPLLLKILQFDKNFPARAGQEIVIGVVYQGRFRASARACEEMRKAARAADTERVAERHIDIVEIDLERVKLRDALDSLKVDVVYVAPLRATDITTITDVSRELNITTVTGNEEYVHQGLSVGLGVWQEKPRVFVNLEASRAEGADFSSRFLSLAQVVK
jgi:YfiR/HmsC-like